MRTPKGTHYHQFAPEMWRKTPNITGDYEMDASIVHCKNKAVPAKLSMYTLEHNAYRSQTAYNAYSGYTTVD